MKHLAIYLIIFIAGGILLTKALPPILLSNRTGIEAPDGTKHYVPDEIVAKKDCAGFNKWRDSLARPGFVSFQVCPWAPPIGPIAHFLVKYVNFTIPREYLYLGEKTPDGPVDLISVEFKYPSMEAAKQDFTKVVGADNVTTDIRVLPLACMQKGKCVDGNLSTFQRKAWLNKFDMFTSNPPRDEEEAKQKLRECHPNFKICRDKYEKPSTEVRNVAVLEWEETQLKCRLEHDVCRANPLVKVKDHAEWGLIEYKYGIYTPGESLYIDAKDDPLRPKYWLFCVDSPDGTRAQCKSEYYIGALGIDYRFEGKKHLANHRDIRDKLTKKIISLVNSDDIKYLDIRE